MTDNCYVRVTNNTKQEYYDIGPFSHSGNEPFSELESAINWVYRQIGLIKVQTPDAKLIKHRWNYDAETFFGSKADIYVEIGDFAFEIINLIDSKYYNVIEELFTQPDISPLPDVDASSN